MRVQFAVKKLGSGVLVNLWPGVNLLVLDWHMNLAELQTHKLKDLRACQ